MIFMTTKIPSLDSFIGIFYAGIMLIRQRDGGGVVAFVNPI